MKALTISEPYASLIREGCKRIETRSWATRYRGEILIHAGARIPKEYRNHALMDMVQETRQGKIIAKARLVDCIKMTPEFIAGISDVEKKCGFYSPGRVAWILEDVEPIEDIRAKGSLGLWEYENWK